MMVRRRIANGRISLAECIFCAYRMAWGDGYASGWPTAQTWIAIKDK